MIKKIVKKILHRTMKKKFASFGKNAVCSLSTQGHLHNVHVGNFSVIGPRTYFNSLLAQVFIGDYVVLAPEVVFITGNHRINVLGKYILEVTNDEKLPLDDQDIIVEDDVWTGTRAIILKGVHINRGAVIGAGSVVTKNVPAYSIVGGVPAKVLSYRFTPSEIEEHERILKIKHSNR